MAAFATSACGGGGGGGASGGGGQVGQLLVNPNTGLSYVVDSNEGGNTNVLRLLDVAWGRLVDIQDSTGTTLFRDFVIGEDIASDGVDFSLDQNPVTSLETLTILHQVNTPGFESAFSRLETNLTNLLDKGLEATELPPYTMVPRNSAMVLRFNDLLDDGGDPSNASYPGTVSLDSIQVYVGYPPKALFGARVFPDPNHGDVVGGQFHSTRAIVDFAISNFDSELSGAAVNSLGLPAAVIATQPNLALRLPTQVSPAGPTFTLLRSLGGSQLGLNGNGSNDPQSPTLDIVRAARSGGTQVGDPNNGFLVDQIPPKILGAQTISLSLTAIVAPGEVVGDVTFATKTCAAKPKAGDVIELPSYSLLVTKAGKSPVNGTVTGVALQVLVGDANALKLPLTAVGQYRTVWDPTAGAVPECFVRFSPGAGAPPSAEVLTDADVVVSFSEPMDPASVLPFQSFEVEYGQNPVPANPLFRRVVGNVLVSTDLTTFTFEPSHPLKHHADSQLPPEQYLFSVSSGALGVSDLAGNSLQDALPQVSFTIDPSEPFVDSGGIALDFSSQNEDADAGGWPEIRGQFLQDVSLGVVNPRAVTRFTAPIDPSQAFGGSMVQIPAPIQTPLSNHGSKMHAVWRYVDMGFSLLDDTFHNIDVEGLWWEPYDKTPKLDLFPDFEMRLAHCFYFPDEDIDTGLLPKFAASGLVNKFDSNYADLVLDPPTVVHAKAEGYLIQPVSTISETGRNIAPWPMNRGKAQEDFVYWTWRDTSKLMLGAPNGVGVDPARATSLISTEATLQGLYPRDLVPSIGLPLLMEFRTYPAQTANAQNGFQIAIAINSSANPFFRAFSTGGVLNSGQVVTVQPDQEDTASGGVNPINGQATSSRDNSVYFGQADFVVRLSRLHSIWLDTQALGANFAPAVIEPNPLTQPTGTQVVVAFRGAADVKATNQSDDPTPWLNARWIDPYGDPYDASQWTKLSQGLENYEFRVTEWPVDGDETWTSDPAALDGAKFIQFRATLISNPVNGLSPQLSAIGLSFQR